MEYVDAVAGKYLTFRLAGEEYGVGILKVREIIALLDITTVPRAPRHIRGVVNIRGKIVPVLDLRRKLGLPDVELRPENCIITVMVEGLGESLLIGLLVDGMSEVLQVAGTEVEPLPALKDTRLPFVLGLAKSQGRMRILLDIDKVVSEQNIEGLLELGQVARESAAVAA